MILKPLQVRIDKINAKKAVKKKNNKKLQTGTAGCCIFNKYLPCYFWDTCFKRCGAHR